MNALELADLLETTESTNNRAAAMLRQQAAEIEKLMSLVDILKAVSRDVDIDFLNETINQQAAEIERLETALKTALLILRKATQE